MNNNINHILSPITREAFFDKYWDRGMLYIKRNDISYYKDILSTSDIDAFLSRRDVKYPSIRMSKDGNMLRPEEYTDIQPPELMGYAPKINAGKVFRNFEEGASILLQRMKYSIESLTLLTGGIEQDFGFRAETNIYISSAKTTAFETHYDDHNIIVMQISGVKTWRLYDFKRLLPVLNEPYSRSGGANLQPSHTIDLYPGDLLYIPRGLVHNAEAPSGTSIHLSLGFYPFSWTQLLREALKNQNDSKRLKASLLNISEKSKENYGTEYKQILNEYLDSIEF